MAGRPKGQWYKWKRAPLTLDCVLMYAQRGSGKRSSYYSDYTFGAWRTGNGTQPDLVPVGKAYFGFTDDELIEIDRLLDQGGLEAAFMRQALARRGVARWGPTSGSTDGGSSADVRR